MKIQTTKAAVLTKQKHPLVVDEVLLPANLEVGQVLVEIKFSTICGSQLGEIAGIKGEDPYLPHLLGHEGSGVVEKIRYRLADYVNRIGEHFYSGPYNYAGHDRRADSVFF